MMVIQPIARKYSCIKCWIVEWIGVAYIYMEEKRKMNGKVLLGEGDDMIVVKKGGKKGEKVINLI